MTKPLIIGIGNRYRGDDAAGLEVAKMLEPELGSLADFSFCDGETIDLMETWKDRESVFLIDAVSSGEKEVGYLHRFSAHEKEIPAFVSNTSTHLFDIVQVIELAKVLEKLPKRLLFFGIEGKQYLMEDKISPDLQGQLGNLSKQIETEIREYLHA